eukprot:2336572-Rhodomonas_salina.2
MADSPPSDAPTVQQAVGADRLSQSLERAKPAEPSAHQQDLGATFPAAQSRGVGEDIKEGFSRGLFPKAVRRPKKEADTDQDTMQ